MKASLQRIVIPPPARPPPPPQIIASSSSSSQKHSTVSTAAWSFYSAIPSLAETAAAASAVSSRTQQQQHNYNRTMMRHVTVHPTLPYVAYFLDTPNNKTHPLAQKQICVSNYLRGGNTNNNNDVLFTLSMGELAALVYQYDLHASNSPSKQAAALKSLGSIQRLEFFDAATLFYSSSGTTTTTTTTNKNNNNNNNKSDDSATTTSSSTSTTHPKRWQALMVQFHHQIIILNLRLGPNSRSIVLERRLSVPSNIAQKITNFAYRPILCRIHSKTFGGGKTQVLPTSMALPISTNLVVVGCMDGSMRILDIWHHQDGKNKVINIIRGPTASSKKSTADPIVELIAANPYNNNNHKNAGSSDTSVDDDNDDKYYKTRWIGISQKGVAYVWEATLMKHTLAIVDILPPLARLDGHLPGGSTLFTTQQTVDSSHNSSSTDNMTEQDAWEECRLVTYDAHRNLLFWLVPTGYKGSNKAHVLVWNLSHVVSLDNNTPEKGKASTKSPRKNKTVPKQEPLLILTVPKEIASVETGLVTLLAGWCHPAFPDTVLTCALVTQSGDLHVLACPLSTSSNDNAKGKALLVKNPISFYNTSLSSIHIEDDSSSNTMTTPPKIRIHSLSFSSIMDTTTLLVGTNFGLLSLSLEQDDECNVSGGTLHAHLDANMGPEVGGSVFFVDHSSVYWAPITVPHPNPVGKLSVRNPTLVYKSPPAPHLPVEVQKRPVRLPPQFLRSPSGTFLCLFWQDERRYEILHLGSVLQRCTKSSAGGSSESYSPAVATGTDILSFAWVGDDDHFALLYPPSQLLESYPSSSTPSTILETPTMTREASSSSKDHPSSSKMKGIRKSFTFNKIEKVLEKKMSRSKSSGITPTKQLSPSTTTPSTPLSPQTPEELTTTPGLTTPVSASSRLLLQNNNNPQNAPRVELRVLVGVTENAAEISGSIAAATATILGDITLRGGGGGNRNPPTTLFGGPVLCVGSRGDDHHHHHGGDHHHDGGTAYFYTRRNDDNTTRGSSITGASSYISSGPTLPHPDFVAWDDDGRLCAVVVQRRVAVYLSEQPTFVLLGTALLGSAMEPVVVTSVKFIHGVLYCTTRTTVQCVFLGDLEHEDGICHLDSFLLASKDVPILPTRSIDTTSSSSYVSWAPQTVPMALNHPTILGYQSGSLLVSTVSGLHAIPLNHPLLRIGSLIAAGNPDRAAKWFVEIPQDDHEALASFLDRRGVPDLAVQQLPGLSLETLVDLCLRYGFTERLENIVETYGLDVIRRIDMGRGVVSRSLSLLGQEEQQHGHHSVIVCIGAYLLSEGKTELVRKLAYECLTSECEEGKKEAMVLASLLLAVDTGDARNLMKEVAGNDMRNNIRGPEGDENNTSLSAWPAGAFVREHML